MASALEITINPATFNAGGALAVAYSKNSTEAYPLELRGKTLLPIGLGGMHSSLTGGGGVLSTMYSNAAASDPAAVKGALQISAGVATLVDSVQLNRMGPGFKNTLADLVNKGIIIVSIAGSAQTALQIVSLT